MDQLRSKRPVVVFIFLVSSLLLWAIGNRLAHDLECELGPGNVSHDRGHSCVVAMMADLTSCLRHDPDGLEDSLRRKIPMIRREGHHPNPSQPRRMREVIEVTQREAEYLAKVA
mgnify:CR=1 FL=1